MYSSYDRVTEIPLSNDNGLCFINTTYEQEITTDTYIIVKEW